MSSLNNYSQAVKVIKEAILRSQYRAASAANKEQLSLYYGIGCYVSKNSREGFWGKGASRDHQPATAKGVARASWFLGIEHKEYAFILRRVVACYKSPADG